MTKSINAMSDIHIHIGRKLRAKYQTVVQEPIPEKFLELLEKLVNAENQVYGTSDHKTTELRAESNSTMHNSEVNGSEDV